MSTRVGRKKDNFHKNLNQMATVSATASHSIGFSRSTRDPISDLMNAMNCHFAHECATRQHKLSPISAKIPDRRTFPTAFASVAFSAVRLHRSQTFSSMWTISYRNSFSMFWETDVSHRWWSRPPIASEHHETLLVSSLEGSVQRCAKHLCPELQRIRPWMHTRYHLCVWWPYW